MGTSSGEEGIPLSEGGRKLIVVLVDGMRDDTARERLGFVEGLVNQGRGLRARAQSILPSLSRPCYEAICTGTQPVVNGVVSNDTVRLSTQTSIFDVLRNHGLVSAVAGYHWLSELYCRAPFDYVFDRERTEPDGRIPFGRFYFEDSYPDAHVFADAEALRVRNRPDLLLIHPMGVDDAGHHFGAASKQYASQVLRIDMILARLLPGWLNEGCDVIVTADHGMDEFGLHGGPDDGVRTVPLYFFSTLLAKVGIYTEHTLTQTAMAALFCRILGLPPAETMEPLPADVEHDWFSK